MYFDRFDVCEAGIFSSQIIVTSMPGKMSIFSPSPMLRYETGQWPVF